MKRLVFIVGLFYGAIYAQGGITWLDITNEKKLFSQSYFYMQEITPVNEDGIINVYYKFAYDSSPLIGLRYDTRSNSYTAREVVNKENKELFPLRIYSDVMCNNGFTYFLIADPISNSKNRTAIIMVNNQTMEIESQSDFFVGDPKIQTSWGRFLLPGSKENDIVTIEVGSENNINGMASLKKFHIKITTLSNSLVVDESNDFIVDEAIRDIKLARIGADILFEFMIVGKTYDDKSTKTYIYNSEAKELTQLELDINKSEFEERTTSNFIELPDKNLIQYFYYRKENQNGFYLARYRDNFYEPELNTFIEIPVLGKDDKTSEIRSIVPGAITKESFYLLVNYREFQDKNKQSYFSKSLVIEIDPKTGVLKKTIANIKNVLKYIWWNGSDLFVLSDKGYSESNLYKVNGDQLDIVEKVEKMDGEITFFDDLGDYWAIYVDHTSQPKSLSLGLIKK